MTVYYSYIREGGGGTHSRRGEIYAEQATRFNLKQSDLGTNMALHGFATEDIPYIMREHRSRVQINSQGQCSSEVIDRRCIKHLQLLPRGTALDAYSNLASGTLEWHTEAQLEQLRAQGRDVQT